MDATKIFHGDDDYIYLTIPYCEFYIPVFYFDRGFALDNVDRLTVFGIFNIGVFENGKLLEMRIMNIPSTIDMFVYDTEIRDIKLNNGKTEKCKVYKFYKDSKVCNINLVEDSDNASSYLNMLTSASIPDTIPYGMALAMWRKNLELNGVSFGVSSVILEIILSVIYRNKDAVEEKFSKRYGKDLSTTEFDYITASIRQICQYASTFVGMTFEDMNSMVTTSLNRARDGVKESETPVEKVIKM